MAAPIPQGVADYFWTEAYQRRQLETALLTTFRTWGYGDVIPPMFEYADMLSACASPELQAEMYRFQDRDGSTLALRVDMTIPLARLVGTRLHDYPMPQRFCYAGSVFRHAPLQGARQREFYQAGIELIGASLPIADAEILALTVKALQAVGLSEFRLVLGQMGYFHGLLQALQLAPAQIVQLQQAIDRNRDAAFVEFLQQTALQPKQRQTLETLPLLNGANIHAILTQAAQGCLNASMEAAVTNLRAICTALQSYGVLSHLYLDLTEIHNLGYYTGITFELLAPGLGFPLASGGRYDNLLAVFGSPQPAVGAAFTLDRILVALHNGATATKPRPVAPDLLVAAKQSTACLAIVETWRKQGLHVVVDVSEREGKNLWQDAQQMGARWSLTWVGAGFELYETEQNANMLASAQSLRSPAYLSAEAAEHFFVQLELTG